MVIDAVRCRKNHGNTVGVSLFCKLTTPNIMTSTIPYRRIVLKISGDSFCRNREGGIMMGEVNNVAQQIKAVAETGVQLAIVCGGGNILRGKQFSEVGGIHTSTAHYMGMLATVINALALQDALENQGVPTRVQSALSMERVAEPFIRRRCVRHLEKGRVVIMAAGTGNPFVTTDTAAAMRAREIEADILLKATRVDGVYSDDPEKNPHAVRYSSITYREFLNKGLQVLDATAVHHCMEQNLPILVFDFLRAGNILRAASGEKIGTLIASKE